MTSTDLLPPSSNGTPTTASASIVVPVPSAFLNHPKIKPHLCRYEDYETLYRESIEQPAEFYKKFANQFLDWFRPFTKTLLSTHSDFPVASTQWFLNGQLNVSYNCLDRHVEKHPNKVALHYFADDVAIEHKYTYQQVLEKVCQMAHVLTELGVKPLDRVAIYMNMAPEAIFAMLACARIGAIHSVVFAGFSVDALKTRLKDANCRVLITVDVFSRAGKTIDLLTIVRETVRATPVASVLVWRNDPKTTLIHNNEMDMAACLKRQQNTFFEPVAVDSEHPLFILYTSGSTGSPKGLVHASAGYLLQVIMTCYYVLDIHPEDTVLCTADVGWITGHSYVVYGPLALGATTVLFGSTPMHPTPQRYWQTLRDSNASIFYTAPTALRMLKSHPPQHPLPQLRLLASVGEPIDPDTWLWLYKNVGLERCPVVDTYWQTETGAHVLAPIPGAVPTIPGSATVPFFGIDPVVLDPTDFHEKKDGNGLLAFRKPWPSLARTLWGDQPRYLRTYFEGHPQHYYLTGDTVAYHPPNYTVQGRMDDLLSIAGHRLSTAELEACLNLVCMESAVVPQVDPISGYHIVAFVITTTSLDAVVQHVRTSLGPIYAPKVVVRVSKLPKTRSGKIVRRILKKLCHGEIHEMGDISTLEDPKVLEELEMIAKERGWTSSSC